MRLALTFLVGILALTSSLAATPAQVIMIRHAEKPDSGNGLSKKGFQRAAALVPFFTLQPANFPLQRPVAIFAMCTSKNHQTTRPVQTVSSLATALGVELITAYTYGSYPQMVKDINSNSAYDGKTILICWAHDNMQKIAAEFGVKNAPVFPTVYDRIWLINFTGDKVSSFQDLPQQLMFGDSTT